MIAPTASSSASSSSLSSSALAARRAATADDAPDAARPGLWGTTLGPLDLAAYVTWCAVAYSPIRQAWTLGLHEFGIVRGAGLAALTAQLLLFVVSGHLGRAQRATRGVRIAVVSQGVCALIAVWGLLPNGSVPVALIIVAAQLAPLFPLRSTLVMMFAMNVVLAALMAAHWSFVAALPELLAYLGFQAFAALTTTYARRADDAREALGRINAELLATRQLLLESARSEERLRLSRELHDVAGHKLTALKLQLRAIEAKASESQRPALHDCAILADQLLADVRGVVDMFRRHDGIDLHAALNALVPSLPRPRVTVEIADDLRVAGLDPAETLVRCAQEGLTNAMRHGDADHVLIRLSGDATSVVLQVEDDGHAMSIPVFGNGLRGMTERLAALGGTLVVEPIAAGGLRLRASLPLAA